MPKELCVTTDYPDDVLKAGQKAGISCGVIVFLTVFCAVFGCKVNEVNDIVANEIGSFDLRVNDVSGLDEPWPMVGGLPFPEGELDDASLIRIVDAEGSEVPAQIDVVATWRDGSIRWAQVGVNARPQGDYRVEYGPGVSRSAHGTPLQVRREVGGAFTVDTGRATYAFRPDRLLPERGVADGVVVLEDSGDGAYLIDNRGRPARVSGEAAEIESGTLKEGTGRIVIRREGWYVTGEGEQVARARMWFYFTAGSPFVRMTHSIIFTEDTNELWVRDYGLEFKTPEAPQEAAFAISEATEADRFIGVHAPEEKRLIIAEMFSTGLVEREQRLFTVSPDGDEVYMLQENYPHVLERDFRAVVARSGGSDTPLTSGANLEIGNLWTHSWLNEMEVAGDWGEARYGDHSLMVVMPQLAQRFPKEIAIGYGGVRVAFWSGRSGRDLDFRAVTLVNEYWKRWADNANHPFGLSHTERGPAIGTRIAEKSSNAQGAARTHDVWLLSRTGAMSDAALKARGLAAAHPPLLQADPEWLGASEAVGWPIHPKDTKRFPEVEEDISDFWVETLGGRFGNVELRRSGFIMWGKNVTLGTGPRWFRLSQGTGHYGLDRSAWVLYMRSGERRYYDYGRHFTRFAGDLETHHWTAGKKFKGGFADTHAHLPFYWGQSSRLGNVHATGGNYWTLGWLLEYYLTGDEYANELLLMVADAYRDHQDPDRHLARLTDHHIANLSILYQHTQDETIKDLARQAAHMLIDLDNPVGLNDNLRYGVYYKTSTEWLFPLYLYYKSTGDEKARTVILRALDDKFRFFYSSNQTLRLFLFAEAYNWTGNPAYLRLIKLMVEIPHFGLMGHNYFLGAPTALHAIAEEEEPIEPFPVIAATNYEDSVVRSNFWGVKMEHEFIEDDTLPPLLVGKDEGHAVNLSIYVRMSDEVDENAEPEAVVAFNEPGGEGAEVDNVRVEKEQRFKTKNPGRWHPRRWHFYLTLPAEAQAGVYSIEFPNTATIVVLESDAKDIRLYND